MKFASLGSGSEGNALLISATSGLTRTTVMLDCGFAIKETERRLQKLDMLPADLAGIVVTHEHQDHVGGVFKFARRHRLPVWLSFGTFQAVQRACEGVDLHFCRDSERLSIGDLELIPYTVPHDAREPIQYVAGDGRYKLGVLTDAGQSTPHLVDALGKCDALMLECNHDRQMLANSAYPPSLRQRIGGAFGHLSNDTSAEILAAIDRTRLKTVVGAHLSQQNNTPELARAALCSVVDAAQVRIACQEEGFDWIDLNM
ncbi:MBL fold metallo-hydrolase [Noviherbaspirillum sp.]|uniref:MBL fold metallo-hydrolase n=1 Tax=Noviherbaspirillum sp. TaxID=1926288 RepID=UPI002B46BD61|nr:MBL fold metallo-hydrolase [Noviherbaspirillum sp.]HJV82135.1 MBL fold metallo-hydrolase [Noviherbaspirillum sp.]